LEVFGKEDKVKELPKSCLVSRGGLGFIREKEELLLLWMLIAISISLSQ
jgi:hypothetical protein